MYKNIVDRLKEEKGKISIGLFTHNNPDYDAVCSTLTLGNYLKNELGDKVEIYPVIDKFKFNLNINSSLEIYDNSLDKTLDYGIVMDVNETDRVYGLSLFNSIDKNNRYLYDHHDRNRVELDVLDNQKIVLTKSSSTCEALGLDLLQSNTINESNAYNIYLGITSDTAGFTRQVSNLTNKVIKLLNLSDEVKTSIFNGVINLSPVQNELMNRITEEKSNYENLKLYKLVLNEDEVDKIKELKNKFIEEKITPNELDIISILLIVCGTAVFLKIRKNENSELDILTLAQNCNGGGHPNRCAGRFYNTNYEEVLSYINDLFNELNYGKSITRKR